MSNSPDENPFGGMPFFGDLAKAMASQGPLQWDVARQVAVMTATHGSYMLQLFKAIRIQAGSVAVD